MTSVKISQRGFVGAQSVSPVVTEYLVWSIILSFTKELPYFPHHCHQCTYIHKCVLFAK